MISDEHRTVLERKIRGYESKAIVEPKAMIAFPRDLRRNLQTMLRAFSSSHEQHYMKALVDPFHHDS